MPGLGLGIGSVPGLGSIPGSFLGLGSVPGSVLGVVLSARPDIVPGLDWTLYQY